MVIVYCGELWYGGTCRMRLEALERLGHTVIGVDSAYRPTGPVGFAVRALRKLGYAADPVCVNEALFAAAARHEPEVVWIDKGLTIRPSTLTRVREQRPGVRLVHYSPDDVRKRHSQSWQYLKCVSLYDLHVTTKSFNVTELYSWGARAVVFVNNAYCPRTHRPVSVSAEDRARLGGPVGFIGGFEEDRAEAVRFLVQNGISVRVWGGAWGRWASRRRHPNLMVEDRCVWGEDYARAICAFDINLGFLRKLNRDLQTTRSVEIPACRGFLLAERTVEHLRLFEEGVEAEYFASSKELLEKCRYYLARPEERLRIAAAGRLRCIRSDYSYGSHVGMVLEKLRRLREEMQGAGPLTSRGSLRRSHTSLAARVGS